MKGGRVAGGGTRFRRSSEAIVRLLNPAKWGFIAGAELRNGTTQLEF